MMYNKKTKLWYLKINELRNYSCSAHQLHLKISLILIWLKTQTRKQQSHENKLKNGSAPDPKTGQSRDTATGVSVMTVIIFWVKQSDTAWQNSIAPVNVPRGNKQTCENLIWGKSTSRSHTNFCCRHTHRSTDSKVSCTWCDAGLGSHWSPGKNTAWVGWIEAGEGSCFLGYKDAVQCSWIQKEIKSRHSCMQD